MLADKKESPANCNRMATATDPNFIASYYQRSRLHLISTLAQEMRQWVEAFRAKQEHPFPARQLLQHLSVDQQTWTR